MQKILAIAGPTASGKSDVAVKLAKRLDGEIISVDSMQIYKDMNIGTAKITKSEMQGIPHYLIDIIPPNKPFSVSDFVAIAKSTINSIAERGKLPILVGGTGLYFESLIYPFELGGTKSDDNVKANLYEQLNKYGANYLHQKLMEIDPIDAQKIHPNNTKRLIRALEIYELTGSTKSNLANKTLQYDLDMYVLERDRELLYNTIERRVYKMFENGLTDEVGSLLDKGITFDMQSMQGIGYKEFKGFFEGEVSVDDVISQIILNSRHYAKRQITWFKRYDFAEFIEPEKLLKKFDIK